MLVTGYDGDRIAFQHELDHGVDPLELGRADGYRALRPLAAHRLPTGRLTLDLAVAPTEPGPPAEPAPALQDRDLDRSELTSPPKPRQRIAAYGLITSERGLLATEYSDLTSVAGLWGLAGGGVEDDEQPVEALTREAYEEAGQRVEVAELFMINSGRWIRRPLGPGLPQDLHTIRLFYRGWCAEPVEPVVHDVGGTTSAARWVPLDALSEVPWAGRLHALIESALSIGTN
ncbi:NUDIX hydrolase [Microlunatus sp. GCM10028923]|uniref:NUDIX hydrolase n=1 Tax=Microlunatus sp. GCM10028923 TaxID=3273400 RepID=UPI003606EA18